jgi:hypothetical protein
MKILAYKTGVDSRILVHGTSAGEQSRGQYVPDCKITATKGLTQGKARRGPSCRIEFG